MNAQLMPVQFYGDTIYLVDYEGQPFVPVKPIVENLGLAWQSQHAKLTGNKKKWGITMIVIPSVSGNQETVCMPLRKFPAFLYSIDARKVKPEIREKIEMYQAECDEVLWKYWTEGEAINPRKYSSHDGKLPNPGLSMDAISRLCRDVDKSFKGKVILRTLNYFTGMPVDDLINEIDGAVSLADGMTDYLLTGFVDACCLLDAQAQTPAGDLYEAFCLWFVAKSEKHCPSQKAFGWQMGKRFVRKKSNGIRFYVGVALKEQNVISETADKTFGDDRAE